MTENMQASVEQVRMEVKRLIAQVTEREPDEIGDHLSLKHELGVDSLTAMEIMVEMDKRFHIDIPENEFDEIATVEDAVAAVQRHLQKTLDPIDSQ